MRTFIIFSLISLSTYAMAAKEPIDKVMEGVLTAIFLAIVVTVLVFIWKLLKSGVTKAKNLIK